MIKQVNNDEKNAIGVTSINFVGIPHPEGRGVSLFDAYNWDGRVHECDTYVQELYINTVLGTWDANVNNYPMNNCIPSHTFITVNNVVK